MRYRIALAQLDLDFGKPDHNFALVEESVKKAAASNADLVLLPELWASGFDLKNSGEYASPLGEGWFKETQSLAEKYKIGLGGTLIERHTDHFFNTFVLYDQEGTLLASYRKIHLFGMLEEDRYLQPGNLIETKETPWGIVGLSICYDLRFPEVFRKYSVAGAEIILLSAEWPAKRIEHWKVLLRTRAIENQIFVAAVNKVGISQGAKIGGASCIIDPMGNVLAEGDNQAGLLHAEIDLSLVEKTRRWMPVFQDRSPESY